MIENGVLSKFKSANKTAGILAKRAVQKSKKKILIAGSLPPKHFTYFSEMGTDLNLIKRYFYEQA
jgi:predicted Fe-Mo cluster-binding NifX family protein